MKTLVLTGLVSVFAVAAMAQEGVALVEFSGQYQMLRVNSSSQIPAFTANGGTGSFAINFFDQLSGVLEVGMAHNGNINNYQLSNNWLTYLVGPRVSLVNRRRRVVPALELLAGGATVFGNITDPVTLANFSRNTTGFAMAAGGTLDIKLNHTITLRPIELDYLLTRINNSTNQNNLRYSAGIVFTLGNSID